MNDCCGDRDEGNEALICFARSHCYPSVFLQFAEVVFDQVAPFVDIEIDVQRLCAPGMLGDADHCAAFVQFINDPVDVEGLVSQKAIKFNAFYQGLNADCIVAVSRQKLKADQIAQRVRQGQDFGCQDAFGLAYSLAFSRPFAP